MIIGGVSTTVMSRCQHVWCWSVGGDLWGGRMGRRFVLVYPEKWHSTAARVKDLPRGFTQHCECNQPSQCATTAAADTSRRQWHRASPSILSTRFYRPALIQAVTPHWGTAEVRLYIHVCQKKIRKQTDQVFLLLLFESQEGNIYIYFYNCETVT